MLCIKCGKRSHSRRELYCAQCIGQMSDIDADFAKLDELPPKPNDLCICCHQRRKSGGGRGPYCKSCYFRIQYSVNTQAGGEPGCGLCSQCGFRPKVDGWNVCKECIKAINEEYWQRAQDDIVDPKTKEIEHEPLLPMERCESPGPTGPHIEYIPEETELEAQSRHRTELPPVMLCPQCYQPMDFWDAAGTIAFHCMRCQRSVISAGPGAAPSAIAGLALETAEITNEADRRRYAIHGEEE